jgi:hypothetical protein
MALIYTDQGSRSGDRDIGEIGKSKTHHGNKENSQGRMIGKKKLGTDRHGQHWSE